MGRRVLIWFAIGIAAPGVLWLLGQAAALLHLDQAQSGLALVALGSWPFWLLLWFPAMSDPDTDMLFYLMAAASLIANGLLYSLMAPIQGRLAHVGLPVRVLLLAVVYAALIALGYGVCLAPDYLAGLIDQDVT